MAAKRSKSRTNAAGAERAGADRAGAARQPEGLLAPRAQRPDGAREGGRAGAGQPAPRGRAAAARGEPCARPPRGRGPAALAQARRARAPRGAAAAAPPRRDAPGAAAQARGSQGDTPSRRGALRRCRGGPIRRLRAASAFTAAIIFTCGERAPHCARRHIRAARGVAQPSARTRGEGHTWRQPRLWHATSGLRCAIRTPREPLRFWRRALSFSRRECLRPAAPTASRATSPRPAERSAGPSTPLRSTKTWSSRSASVASWEIQPAASA